MTVRAEDLPHFGKAGDVRTARSLFAVTILVLAVLPAVAIYGYITVQYGRGDVDSETRCRRCGYILRGITETRCPECGEAI